MENFPLKTQTHTLLKTKNNQKLKIFISVFLIILCLFSSISFAGTWDNPEKDDFKSSLGYTAYNWCKDIYGREIFANIGDILLIKIPEAGASRPAGLSFDTATSDKSPSQSGADKTKAESQVIWWIMTDIYDIIQPVGYALILLYFLLSLMDKIQSDNLSPEVFVKAFIKLIAAILLIANGIEILRFGIELSNAIFTAIGSTAAGSDAEETLKQCYETLKKAKFLDSLGHVLSLILPWLLMYVCNIVTYCLSIGRIVQIYAMAMFAPIAMSNIYEGGLNSSGFRYFKKFVAVGLQGAVILVILLISTKMLSFSIVGETTNLFSPVKDCVISLTTVMLIIKSQSWANDIMGV